MATETKSESPKLRLFKYFHPERTDVLRNAAIRFSSTKVLNDPFELKPYISGFSNEGYVRSEVARLMPKMVAQQYSEAPAELQRVLSLEVFQALSQTLLPSIERTAAQSLELFVSGTRKIID